MKIVKRRARCYGCRCHTYSDVLGDGCQCGFRIDLREVIKPWGKSWDAYPSEPCPRPTNWNDYSDALDYEYEQRKKRNEKVKE